jgi:hypothetical protein
MKPYSKNEEESNYKKYFFTIIAFRKRGRSSVGFSLQGFEEKN